VFPISFCNVTASCVKHYWFRDVNKCHSIVCKFLGFWGGAAEVFIRLECGAASQGAYRYEILYDFTCMSVYTVYKHMACEGFAYCFFK
jgi:hypothetical protein